jgi:hypothetical protein
MSKPVYPKRLLNQVRRMVRMYTAVSKGKRPRWVCLCDAIDPRDHVGPCGASPRRPWKCPAMQGPAAWLDPSAAACQGPGGSWNEIHAAIEMGHDFTTSVKEAAGKKAKAWQAWLRRNGGTNV